MFSEVGRLRFLVFYQYRLYREEGLALHPRLLRRRKAVVTRREAVHVTRPNDAWSLDFVADQLAERVRALVYLDAIIPQNGKSMMDLNPQGSADHYQALADEIDGYSIPPMTAEVFNVNEADAAWVDAKCTNHPIGCFTEVISLTGNHATVSSRTFILAEDFEFDAIRNSYENVKDDQTWNVMTMEGGHELMVDKPGAVANVLLDLS